MPFIDQACIHNRLLRQLQPEDFALLTPHLEPVMLLKGDVLSEPCQPFEHAIFPESGVVSIISVSPEGQAAESGLVGRDGFTPVNIALDVDRTPQRCIVQVPGTSHRIAAGMLRDAQAASPALRGVLLHFAHTLTVQASCTVLSNAVHCVDRRLARWLLMCHDRITGNGIALTHEFLALMLAVRRASVTTALHVLESNRLIQARLGIVTVTDRPGLEAFAGDAYGLCEAEYARLLGPMR